MVEAIPGFLAWLRQNGRADLAESVGELDRRELDSLVASAFRRKSTAGDILPPKGGSHEPDNPAALFVIESLLQAWAERLANGDPPSPGSIPMRCPRCAALPVAAVLREEGHGAKRSLLCALCLQEWECLRIVCPVCGEQDFDKLPIYTAEQFAHVRIDACDRCHHHIKTIDLTDGSQPCVDDIASVADLWARADTREAHTQRFGFEPDASSRKKDATEPRSTRRRTGKHLLRVHAMVVCRARFARGEEGESADWGTKPS